MVVVAVVSLGMMTAFNFSLKSAYLTGGYKNRFREQTFTGGRVSEINVKAPGMHITVEHGLKEGVWVPDYSHDQVQIALKDGILTLSVSDTSATNRNVVAGITVVTNQLNKLNLLPLVSSTVAARGYQASSVVIAGLKTDSLTVQMADFTFLELKGVEMRGFKAVVGDETHGSSSLSIDPASRIGFADISVPGRSTLSLSNAKIVKTRYNLGDSATVVLNGSVLKTLQR